MDYIPHLEPMAENPKYPKLRIDCLGDRSLVYVNGIALGQGVKSVEFRHEGGEHATLRLEFDVAATVLKVPVDVKSGLGAGTPAPESTT